MSSNTLPVLARLRARSGAWMICVAVLLFKIFASSICMADRPHALPVSAGVTFEAAASYADAQLSSDEGACLLGEVGGCHCACAHAVPLSAVGPLHAFAVAGSFDRASISSGYLPPIAGSLLRPPIA
jgi:hypothetical protein